MVSLIASDDTWTLRAVILGIAALGLWAERTCRGRRNSGYAADNLLTTGYLLLLFALPVGRRWNGLIIPSILTGTLGYAAATFIGPAAGRG